MWSYEVQNLKKKSLRTWPKPRKRERTRKRAAHEGTGSCLRGEAAGGQPCAQLLKP